MPTLARQLTDLVRAATSAACPEADLPLEACVPAQDPKHGDYQSNHAFRLAKAAKANPREVAARIAAAVPTGGLVARVDVAGPGFLNLRLSDSALAEDVVARGKDEWLGADRDGTGRTMVIDFSSPNIAKRMHVGHLRSTIIGNAIDRAHRFLGWNVVADNHIGDWGTQFGKLIVVWRRAQNEAAYREDAIAELQRLYQLFGEMAEKEPALEAQSRLETAKLQSGDAENRALWEDFCRVSMVEFDGVYRRLGIRFDVVCGESFYRDWLVELVDRLLATGIAVEDQGAVIVRFTAEDGKGLADRPLLVRKSDGAALYGTTDIATVEYRVRTWNPDLIVYVTDIRQRGHFDQVFAAVRKMGVTVPFQHVGFGLLRFPDGAVAATRAGVVMNLVDVLDTARDFARKVVDEKSGALPETERASIAEAVGIGAILYQDLCQNPQSDITFDLGRALSLEGNTAPYLMYAHARCRSILRKAAEEGRVAGPVRIEHPSERALVLAIARLPEAVAASAATYRPNLLCDQIFGLAEALAAFYRDCRVLGEGVPADVSASRLTIVATTAQALSTGMELLGLRPLERM